MYLNITMESAAKAKHICNNIIKNIYSDYKNKQHRNATPAEASANVDDLVGIELLLKRIYDRQNITVQEILETSTDYETINTLIKRIIDRRDATIIE